MAVVGNAAQQTPTASQSLDRFYSKDPMHGLARSEEHPSDIQSHSEISRMPSSA